MPTVKAGRPRTRRRGVTRISSKNQVTLPVEALRKARLRAGAELRVEAEGAGRLVLIQEDDPISRYAGILRYPKGYLKKLRGEWRY